MTRGMAWEGTFCSFGTLCIKGCSNPSNVGHGALAPPGSPFSALSLALHPIPQPGPSVLTSHPPSGIHPPLQCTAPFPPPTLNYHSALKGGKMLPRNTFSLSILELVVRAIATALRKSRGNVFFPVQRGNCSSLCDV